MSLTIERVLAIVQSLSESRVGYDIDSLASLYGVSGKTIRRDLICLRRMGYQLQESAEGRGKKRYWLERRPPLAMSLTFDEALAIFVGCHTSLAYSGSGLGQAAESSLRKLRQALEPLELDYLERQLPKFHRSQVGSDYRNHREILDALQLAIEDRQVITITYQSAERHQMESDSNQPGALTYEIHPYGLVEHRGTLYVVGYSRHRQAMRTWKLERISTAELKVEKFRIPLDFDLQHHLKDAFAILAGENLQTIKVRFTNKVARAVVEKPMHFSQQVTRHGDGSIIAEYRLSSLVEIKSWILSFGAQAEVLEPKELRDEFADEARRYMELYQPAVPFHKKRTAKVARKARPR